MNPKPTSSLSRRAAVSALAAAPFAGLAGALSALPSTARAQPAFPARPLRLVVPFTPGGSTDLLARALAQELSGTLPHPVTVENLPGAGGAIGAERVARAPADGHVLLMGHIGTLAVNPLVYPKLAYDPVRDFAPVAWMARVPNVLVAPPDLPADSLVELVALLRAKPGRLNYGSGGNGSAAHLATEYLKAVTRTSIVHLPYRGTAPAVTDLLAGQVQLMFTGVPAVLGHLRAGRLKALAVSSPMRLAVLPQVPTVAESGIAGTSGFEADQWYGVVAPAGTPPERVERLNASINAALASAALQERLSQEGALSSPDTPARFGQLIRDEIERWRPVVRAAGIRPD